MKPASRRDWVAATLSAEGFLKVAGVIASSGRAKTSRCVLRRSKAQEAACTGGPTVRQVSTFFNSRSVAELSMGTLAKRPRGGAGVVADRVSDRSYFFPLGEATLGGGAGATETRVICFIRKSPGAATLSDFGT